MKKKITLLVLAVVLCFTAMIPACAVDGVENEYSHVIDSAELLTQSEETALNQKLYEISTRQGVDVVVVTTNSLGGKSTSEYADDIYDDSSFGYGDDGVLLLISMEYSDWYISTCGYGITAFTDSGIAYIGEQIVPYLSGGDFIGAFNTFAQYSDDFITQAKNGSVYNSSNLPKEPLSLIWIPISLAIGIVLALLVVGSMKSKLKSVSKKKEANSYVKKGSMAVTENFETFLYSNVTKTKKESQNSSSSSTHTSSSGRTHGGGGGKF